MRVSGSHRGVSWQVEVASLATISLPGRQTNGPTKRYEEWPSEAALAEWVAAHIDRSVDGLPPPEEPRVLTQGDAGFVEPKKKRK